MPYYSQYTVWSIFFSPKECVRKLHLRRGRMESTKEFWSRKQLTDASAMERYLLARRTIGTYYTYSKVPPSQVKWVGQTDLFLPLPPLCRDEVRLQQRWRLLRVQLRLCRRLRLRCLCCPHESSFPHRQEGRLPSSRMRNHGLAPADQSVVHGTAIGSGAVKCWRRKNGFVEPQLHLLG